MNKLNWKLINSYNAEELQLLHIISVDMFSIFGSIDDLFSPTSDIKTSSILNQWTQQPCTYTYASETKEFGSKMHTLPTCMQYDHPHASYHWFPLSSLLVKACNQCVWARGQSDLWLWVTDYQVLKWDLENFLGSILEINSHFVT